MFILTNEIKGKLLKDLKRNVRFDNMSFHFEGNLLICFSVDFGLQTISFNKLPSRCSYTSLLKTVSSQLYDVIQSLRDAREMLKNMNYNSLLEKTLAIKSTKENKDIPLQYEKDGVWYHFVICVYAFDGTEFLKTGTYITQDVLNAHSVDTATFFEDLAESYKKEGKDLITDAIPA